jgi:hypothetical protein
VLITFGSKFTVTAENDASASVRLNRSAAAVVLTTKRSIDTMSISEITLVRGRKITLVGQHKKNRHLLKPFAVAERSIRKARSAEELSLGRLRKVLKKTAADVHADNLGRGIPMTVLENNQVVKIYPNGRREILKSHVPPTVKVSQAAFQLK